MSRVSLIALGSSALLAACSHGAPEANVGAIGDPQRGHDLIASVGCGACHEIPGVSGANGRVGPPLTGIAQRTVVAGVLPNTPANLIRWIQSPQSIVPGNAMPNMELSNHDARDIAAYLYSQG